MLFSPEDIIERVKDRVPFVPVRIMCSSEQHFDVFHPDMLLVGRHFLTIGTASKKNPRIFDKEARVSILHVNALEDIPARGSSKSNGRKG